MADPLLSVVIADPGWGVLEAGLSALAPQRDAGVEVIVVSNRSPPEAVRGRFDWVSWLDRPEASLVPELWGAGIARAGSDLVVLTTSHFLPAPNWLSVIREARVRLGALAVGGPVDPPEPGRAATWATYFLRYSAYLNLAREMPVGDLAADNACYARGAIAAQPGLLRSGFWEQDLHRVLRGSGEPLYFLPQMRVRLGASLPLRRFARERFEHGRRFGRARLTGRSSAFRALALLAAPLVPGILLSRIAARVARSGRDRAAFARALPPLVFLVLAWSLGEAVGYAAGGLEPAVAGAGDEPPSD